MNILATVCLTVGVYSLLLWWAVNYNWRRHVCKQQNNFRKKFLKRIEELGKYPTKRLNVNGMEYLVAYIPSYQATDAPAFLPKDIREQQARENAIKHEYNWGVFCGTDVEQIKLYILANPDVAVLNIPTEFIGVACPKRAIYKVIKIK